MARPADVLGDRKSRLRTRAAVQKQQANAATNVAKGIAAEKSTSRKKTRRDTTALETSEPTTTTATLNGRTFTVAVTGGARKNLSVKFRTKHDENDINEIPPTSAEFNEARLKNQHMLQNLALSGREVETGANSNNIRNITRKRANRWSPQTARTRANHLAQELYPTVVVEEPINVIQHSITRKKKQKKKTAKRKAKKTHAHK